jgi:DNA-binding CsgD family transcriptional regulator
MDHQHKQSARGAHDNRQSMPTATPSAVVLTEKEQQILHWAAMGKTTWEISRIQGRTEAAVNFHLCNIRRKFGVNSLRAALMKAIDQGMVV